MGRHTTFSAEAADLICAELADGKSLRDIERDHGLKASTVCRWGRGENGADPSFAQRYARANDAGARAQFRQIEELERRMMQPRTIEETIMTEQGPKVVKVANPDWLDPHAGRVVIDSMKWRLSKMLPKEYGDRVGVEHSGSVEFKPSNAMPAHLGAIIDAAVQKEDEEHTTH